VCERDREREEERERERERERELSKDRSEPRRIKETPEALVTIPPKKEGKKIGVFFSAAYFSEACCFMLTTSCLCLEHFVPLGFRNLLIICLFTYYVIMAEVTIHYSLPVFPPTLPSWQIHDSAVWFGSIKLHRYLNILEI